MVNISQHSTALKILLIIASLTAIGLLCYWFVLSLPLFWDDIFQFSWLYGVGLRDIWTSPVPRLRHFAPSHSQFGKCCASRRAQTQT